MLFIIVCLVRHNGIVYILFIPLIILLFRLYSKRTLKIFMIQSVTLFLVLKIIVPHSLGLDKNTPVNYMGSAWKMHIIAALLMNNYYTDNEKHDEDVIKRIVDLNVIKTNYDPLYVDPIYFNEKYNRNISNREIHDLNKLLLLRAIENYPILISFRSRIFFTSLYNGMIFGDNLESPKIQMVLDSKL